MAKLWCAFLLAAGADAKAEDSAGFTPLHCACVDFKAAKHRQLLSLLLEHGANVNTCTEEGYTPLAYLAQQKTGVEDMKVLLAAGANPCGPTCESTFSYNALCFVHLNFGADSSEARLLRVAASACATDAPVARASCVAIKGTERWCVVLGVVVHSKLEAKADVEVLILRLATREEIIDTWDEDTRCLDYLHFYLRLPALLP